MFAPDIDSRRAGAGDASEAPSLTRRKALDRGRVFALGLNTWAVLVLVPYVLASPRPRVPWSSYPEAATSFGTWLGFALLGVPFPLFALAVGIGLLRKQRTIAAWTLLAVFPVLIGGMTAWLPSLVFEPPYSTTAVGLGAASLIAYSLATTLALEQPVRFRPVTWKPLTAVAPTIDTAVARWSRRALLATGAVLAVGLPIIAPRAGSDSSYVDAWGGVAPEAATFASVLGALVAAGAIGLILGPMMRAPRRVTWTTRQRRRRVTGFLVSFCLGVLFFCLYRLA